MTEAGIGEGHANGEPEAASVADAADHGPAVRRPAHAGLPLDRLPGVLGVTADITRWQKTMLGALGPLLEQEKRWQRSLAPFLDQQDRWRRTLLPVIEQQLKWQRNLAPFIEQMTSNERLLKDALALSDRFTPPPLEFGQRLLAADVARVFAGGTALPAVREALLADTIIRSRVGDWTQTLARASGVGQPDLARLALLPEMPKLTATLAVLTESMDAARVRDAQRFALSDRTVRTLRLAASTVPGDASPALTLGLLDVTRGAVASTGVAAHMVRAPMTRQGEEPAEEWRDGPNRVREDMLERLAAVHPALPDKLRGAWDALARGGPDALSQAANSGIEALDRTLMLSAPTDAVLVWHRDGHRGPDELHNGQPTHGLRVRYLLRHNARFARAVDAQVTMLTSVRGELQQAKHELGFADEGLVRQLLFLTEAVLVAIV